MACWLGYDLSYAYFAHFFKSRSTVFFCNCCVFEVHIIRSSVEAPLGVSIVVNQSVSNEVRGFWTILKQV